MSMGVALQFLFTGLGVGSIYALVALGFVLIYRATNRSICLPDLPVLSRQRSPEKIGNFENFWKSQPA